jgi:hypothetical protein
MLNILKIKDWQASIPLDYYITPLKESIWKLREELIAM